jgi:hypothetical protein
MGGRKLCGINDAGRSGEASGDHEVVHLDPIGAPPDLPCANDIASSRDGLEGNVVLDWSNDRLTIVDRNNNALKRTVCRQW